MSTIEIAGYKRYDQENAREPCDMDKRLMLRECFECMREDQYPAECMLAWRGNTMMLAVKNKRSGRVEYYEVQPRAHWIPEANDRHETASACERNSGDY